MVKVRQRPLDTDHWKTRKEGRKERREAGRKGGKKEGKKEATYIKSNNPHLANREQNKISIKYLFKPITNIYLKYIRINIYTIYIYIFKSINSNK